MAQLRSVLMAAAAPERVRRVVDKLFELAAAGDLQAIREVLLRVLGKPLEADLIERLEALEARLAVETERKAG